MCKIWGKFVSWKGYPNKDVIYQNVVTPFAYSYCVLHVVRGYKSTLIVWIYLINLDNNNNARINIGVQ